MDPSYGKEIKLAATDALQSAGEELPPVSSKEAAEVVAKAAVAALNTEDLAAEEEEDDAIGGEDEHWAMAAYMEGISEEQETLDAIARKQLSAAFAMMHKGLDKIEEGHKIGQEGVRLQREGLIKLNEVCERNPLYEVARYIESAFGEDTSLEKDQNKDGDKTDKISGEELKAAIAKMDFPKPSVDPQRIYDGVTKTGQKRRKYSCPKPKCKYVRVNREAVCAHIRKSHDHVTLGPCNGCGTFYSPNKESLIVHMQGCAQSIAEVLKVPQEHQDQDDEDDDDDDADDE